MVGLFTYLLIVPALANISAMITTITATTIIVMSVLMPALDKVPSVPKSTATTIKPITKAASAMYNNS